MARREFEAKIYTEFLTNAAVAWFAAGVIAPLFSPPKNLSEAAASIISGFSCLVFLRSAVIINKGKL